MNTTSQQIDEALRNLKIDTLNPMQIASLRAHKEENDIILLSPTGSGKTLAYLLPLLDELSSSDCTIQCLILVPSRELALQIDGVFKSMNSTLKTCCCYGGHSVLDEKKSILNNQPAIVIGTPGRITDHLDKGNINPDTIHKLIIDEFDKSLEYGFQEEMEDIISQLPALKKRVLLSATDAKEIPLFTGMEKTIKLDFLDPKVQTERLRLMKVISPDKDKLETLYNLLCTLGDKSTIVFCNYREATERVGGY
ncbi:MAG: DEAD/DEAH box helicase, partial [Bacteroides sp.]